MGATCLGQMINLQASNHKQIPKSNGSEMEREARRDLLDFIFCICLLWWLFVICNLQFEICGFSSVLRHLREDEADDARQGDSTGPENRQTARQAVRCVTCQTRAGL